MEGDKKFIIGKYSDPEVEYLKNNRWIFTEKVDGTNIRVMWDGKEVVFAGRSDDAQLYTPLIYKLDALFKTLEPRKKFEEIFGVEEETDVCLYGEGYGAKIQKGGGNYIPDGVDFVLFDVKVGNTYLERFNVEDVAEKFGLKAVPIIGYGTIDDAIEMVKKGFKSRWGDFTAEGIVARPEVELKTRTGERVITKVKYRDFNLPAVF
jgi:ATP-dependent RNA circularization protein (DNA/RNA ligase family)